MEMIGWLALVLILCYSAYPGRVRRLERKFKKIERRQEGDVEMSKIINELIGKNCKIKAEDAFKLNGVTDVSCTVLDADDEWIKFTYTDKKGAFKTQILRIDSIDSVELLNE